MQIFVIFEIIELMQTKTTYRYLILIIITVIFVGCKKYPKNWLLFNSPEKTLARGVGEPWILTSYIVNNTDSTFADYLNVYKNEGLVIPETARKSSEQEYNCSDIIDGFWEFTNKKKTIHFKFAANNFHANSYVNTSETNQKNIFLKAGQGWNIDKLTKDDFWIITEFNNTKYELHFK